MPANRVIIIIAAGLLILDVLWLLIRGKKNGFIPKEQRTKKVVGGVVSSYCLAVLLLGIMWFREFGIFADCVLAGCSVLAVEVENRLLLGTVSEYDE